MWDFVCIIIFGLVCSLGIATKIAISNHALSFDTISPVNPWKFSHKLYIATDSSLWAMVLPL